MRTEVQSVCRYFFPILLSEFTIELLSKKSDKLIGKKVITDGAPTYLLLPLGKRGSKWGDFHWAMGCV